jgi:Family of unknown function (DUF6232)
MEAMRHGVRPSGDRSGSGSRTFYRDGAISVTDRWLLTPSRRYPIGELANLRSSSQATASPVAAVSAAMSGVLGVAAATFVMLTGDPAVMMLGPLAAGLPLSVALVSWRIRRRFHVLYADFAGRTVQVLGDHDERRFNQICRALLRAREYGRDHTY